MAEQLEQLVSETIALTGAAPPAVLDEDAPVLSDQVLRAPAEESIYLVGIIGGKDVGKSSLVNAIVGEPISTPTSHGPGTEHVIAYCHESSAEQVRRLLESELPGRFSIIVHHNDDLVRQVLLDLPDIDSHWASHIEITRRMLRHILFPVWIQSIEKYADLQPQQLLSKVAAGNDPSNFIFCLNKIDQLLSRESPEALRELQDDYARRLARTLSLPKHPRVFLISATHPDQADLPGLRELLSREKSAETVDQSRELAIRRRDRSLLAWLDQQDLSERSERLARLQREAEELLAARVGVPLLEVAIPRLMDDPAHRLSMLEPAVHRRLSRWPVVSLIDALLSPLLALVRKNLSARPSSAGGRVDLHLDDGTRSLSSLLQSTFAHLHQSHPLIAELYRERKLWNDLPADTAAADLRARLDATIARQRDAILQRAGGRYGVVAPPFRWLLTYGAILWFPFVQPVLEAWLAPGFGSTLRELAYLAVQILGVTYLLKNVTFLVIWFLVLWLVLRFGTQRRVNRMLERFKSTIESRDGLSLSAQVMGWMDELLSPIASHRDRIDSIVRRADQLRSALRRPPAAAA